MDIKHVFEDSRIVMLEEDIARINEYCKYSDKEKFVLSMIICIFHSFKKSRLPAFMANIFISGVLGHTYSGRSH